MYRKTNISEFLINLIILYKGWINGNGNSSIILTWLYSQGTTFMYLQYSRPLIYHFLPNVWKTSFTISMSIFVDVPYWPHYSMDKFISCVVPGPTQWFFHFDEEIVIAYTQEKTMTLAGTEPHCQRCNRSVTAEAVWLIALSWTRTGFCTTKCRRFLLSARRRWCCMNVQ